MALRKKGKYYYGDNKDDLNLELKRYAELNKYPIDENLEIKCVNCGQHSFKLFSDNDENGALCQCVNCSEDNFIKDSQEYINLNELENYECLCGNSHFYISGGLSFYQETEEARWVYVGGYCSKCGLVGNYIDWNEK